MEDIRDKIRRRIKEKGIASCKKLLSDKKVTILSCGPSIEDYKDLIKRKDNTIIATIKTATNYSKGDEDFFFYDNRIFDGHRHNFKYTLNSKSIKVFTHDYLNEENDAEKTAKVKSKITRDIQMCVNPNAPAFCIDDCKIKFTDQKKRIYYDGNILMPIFIRVIVFFANLGVKKFNLFGVNWYNEDITSQAKHFEPWVQPKIGFDNLIGSFYSNILLDNIIKKYNLNMNVYAEYSQISIRIPRISLNKEVFYQKSNFYKTCKKEIKNNNDLNNNYHLILELCKDSPYKNERWYKTLILMMSKIEKYKFKMLKYDYHNLDTFEWNDYLLSIGVECGIRN